MGAGRGRRGGEAQRGDRDAARGALQALRARPGWEGWLRRLRVNGRLPYTEELLR